MMILAHRFCGVLVALVALAVSLGGCGKDDDVAKRLGDPPSPATVNAAVDGDWETVWLSLSKSTSNPDQVGLVLLDLAAKATSRGFSPEFEFDTSSARSPQRLWLSFTDSLLQVHPDDPEVLFMAADAAARMARYSEARRLFDRAIAADSTMALAYSSRGAINLALLRPDAALADFGRAIEHDPDLAQPWLNRADLQRKQGNLEQALADYDRVVELAPDHAIAYNNRGETYRQLGEVDKALANYSQAIDVDPEIYVAYNNRGLAQAKLGEYELALDDYDRALAIEPEYAPAYYNRGIVWFLSGAYEQAIGDYRKAVELNEDNFQAWYNLAMAYEQVGKTDSVVIALQNFVDHAPAGHEEYVHRARVRINQLTKDPQNSRQ